MINNIFRKKKQLAILLLLIFVVLFSHGQDTLVKKKYLDSVKNQLAIYTVTSYTHLNMYDRVSNEKLQIEEDLKKAKNTVDYLMWRKRKTNLETGAFIFGMMVMSFVMVIKFTQ